MISVVIPILNEEEILETTLKALIECIEGHELIIVDGGSTDDSFKIAEKYALAIKSSTGRGLQMNCGVEAAQGEVILFLHADCRIEEGSLAAIESAMSDPGIVGGCFEQRIDAEGWKFRLIEFMIQIRALHRSCIYGDQGLFIRRSTFEEIGGFPNVPLMEDVVLSKRLRKAGKTCLVRKTIVCSARRWQRLGTARTTITNWYLRVLHSLGVSPHRLAKIYYGKAS
ncbi:MAG: TIGR04283 family arsenosugar biosynthesis glycosyltransferase [Planctomycetota bacterium]|nr:TIGR04283 family arsenosugar biosynthesis glycosyltransferase [Planctomycetota bacterium]MDA1142198.1 TIGR04283 family arsenosugar biosynthesis glycosyltransferase [Planctomycetota bacterium]